MSFAGYDWLNYWYNSMFSTKLLGLILSALLTVTPTNRYTEVSYPLTRNDSIFVRLNYEVYDLGTTTDPGNTHNYDVKYNVDIYCSSACSLTNFSTNDGFLESHVTYTFSKRIMNITSASLANRFAGMSTAQYFNRVGTYQYENTVVGHQFDITYDNGQTQSITVFFCAEPVTTTIQQLGYLIDEFSNLYFMREFLMDKDTDSQTIQTVQNYLNNGDYSSAISYIQNYYYQNSVTQNENNETVINNYSSKETSLNTYYNTENNFTNQVETDFQNQEQQLPDLNNSIQEFQTTSFLSSANWVTQQFNRITTGNIFGSFLIFSLLTGFITALIGRFKR